MPSRYVEAPLLFTQQNVSHLFMWVYGKDYFLEQPFLPDAPKILAEIASLLSIVKVEVAFTVKIAL